MARKTSISVPLEVLFSARYAAAPPVEGSSRPSGSGLTGVDLQLLWFLLDRAPGMLDANIEMLQTDINAVFGRIHVDRLMASLDRLRGTDVFIRNSVIPAVIGYERSGTGQDARRWCFRLDRRLNQVVHDARGNDGLIPIAVSALRALGSRYSIALYGRFQAWKARRYPEDRDIHIGAHPAGRAFQMDVPLDMLTSVFGLYEPLRPSEIERLLVTDKTTCPLRRELFKARVAVDTRMLHDEISWRGRKGLRIRISDIVTEGLGELNAAQAYRRTAAAHYRANR